MAHTVKPISEQMKPEAMGPYLLLHLLGKGGMGEIYLARYDDGSRLGKLCVLKRLRPELTVEESTVRRFLDELRIVVQLRHPRICRVLDVGKVVDNYFLVMEFVDGADLSVLQERAEDQGLRISMSDALNMAKDILEALGYAHELRDAHTEQHLRLIHRDISPENIMIHKNGRAQLIDFGLANSVLKREVTQPEFVFGKMSYMAPEQARGEILDHRIDFFGLGVILYEVLTGDSFYGKKTEEQVWEVCGRGDFIPAKWDSLPGPIQTLLSKALAPEPSNRYGHAREFLSDIRLLQINHPMLFGPSEDHVSLTSLIVDYETERGGLMQVMQTGIEHYREQLAYNPVQHISVLNEVAPKEFQRQRVEKRSSVPNPPRTEGDDDKKGASAVERGPRQQTHQSIDSPNTLTTTQPKNVINTITAFLCLSIILCLGFSLWIFYRDDSSQEQITDLDD